MKENPNQSFGVSGEKELPLNGSRPKDRKEERFIWFYSGLSLFPSFPCVGLNIPFGLIWSTSSESVICSDWVVPLRPD